MLDRETGLVWEPSPSTALSSTLFGARAFCALLSTGNRQGWRLPTIAELGSLFDPSAPPGPRLPAGHPFSNIQAVTYLDLYWSASSADRLNPDDVFFKSYRTNSLDHGAPSGYHWCVRGGQGVDAQ